LRKYLRVDPRILLRNLEGLSQVDVGWIESGVKLKVCYQYTTIVGDKQVNLACPFIVLKGLIHFLFFIQVWLNWQAYYMNTFSHTRTAKKVWADLKAVWVLNKAR